MLANQSWDVLAAARRGERMRNGTRDWHLGLQLAVAALCCWLLVGMDVTWRLQERAREPLPMLAALELRLPPAWELKETPVRRAVASWKE